MSLSFKSSVVTLWHFFVSVDVNRMLSNHELPLLLIENSHCTVATLVQYIRLNHRLPHWLTHTSSSLCTPPSPFVSPSLHEECHSLGLHGKHCHLTRVKGPFHHADLANHRPAGWMSWGDLANKQPHATETFLNTIIMFFKWTLPTESLRMM